MQQRAFSGAVATDDADSLAFPDVKRNVFKCRELAVVLLEATGEKLFDPVSGVIEQPISLPRLRAEIVMSLGVGVFDSEDISEFVPAMAEESMAESSRG